MSTHKRIDMICIIVIVCGLILTLLFMNGEKLGIQKIVDEDSPYYQKKGYFTSNDRNGSYDEEQADTVITLLNDSALIKGNGAYVLDGDIYITGAGKYLLTGTLTDGRVIVDTHASSKVWLILKDVNISCTDDAAVIVEQAEKVFLTLVDGTDNVVTGGDSYNEQAVEAEHTGAIFSRDDLTVNGSGSLTVSAGYMHGIESNDDLVIAGGNITVTAAKDAVKANKNICIASAQIHLTAGDDGLMVNKEEGVLYLESGTIDISSEGDAVNSLGDVIIAGGDMTIDAKDDGIHSDKQIQVTAGTVMIGNCYEGLEAPKIDISGGDITIYPTDDGINANGTAGDSFGMGGGPGMGGPGMGRRQESAEGESAGEEMRGESERPESAGESAEDAAGGSAGEQMGDRPGRPESAGAPAEDAAGEPSGEGLHGAPAAGEEGAPGGEEMGEAPGEMTAAQPDETTAQPDETAAEETWIRISGGTLTIINEKGNDADGLDSNGDIYITGGTVRISLNGSGANCAIDYGSESGGICEISGGSVIAAGGSSMTEPFSDSSAQVSLLYTCGSLTDPDTEVSVVDEQGSVILSWNIPCSVSSVNLSCPEMVQGGTYTVVIGDEETTVTLESISTVYGSASGGSFGGPGGFQGPGRPAAPGTAAAGTAEAGTAEEGAAEAGTAEEGAAEAETAEAGTAEADTVQ